MLVLALGVQAVCTASASEVGSSHVQVSAISPKDGSLWVGTSSEGIFRFGRNGRVLHYSSASGHLKNDEITSLVFDTSGTLYILDGAGSLTRYSSVEGFSAVASFESGVGSLSESAGIPYIIKDSLLYSISSGTPELVRTLPFSISSGSLPDFECENEADAQPEPSSVEKGSALLTLLWIALGICLGLLLGFLLFRKRKAEVVEPVVEEEPIEEPAYEEPAEEVAEVAEVEPKVEAEVEAVPLEEALQATDFGKKVWALVLANLANPGYGVEQVAADLDISRIHVNRKLKAQTGYSPSAVFKFIRMDHASKLLLEGKLAIIDVARQCGFSSASYFSTAFKDYFKQTPSEYVASKSEATGKLDL